MGKRFAVMKALIFQHAPEEGARLLESILAAEGIARHTVELYRGDILPPLDDYQLLLVMGGPQQVWERDLHPWLAPEIAAIRRWVDDLQRPYFGVCLGHQLLAVALGGEVGPADRYELGFPEILLASCARNHPVARVLPQQSRWLQWHQAEVTAVPPGLNVLASSAGCPVQIMALESSVLSVQFHAEGDRKLIDYWTSDPQLVAEMNALGGDDAAARVRAEAREHLSGATRNTGRLFRHWLHVNQLLEQPSPPSLQK